MFKRIKNYLIAVLCVIAWMNGTTPWCKPFATDVKSAADIAAKWGRVTPQRSADYEAGASGAGAKQNAAAIAAAAAYQNAVSSGSNKAMFIGGLKRAGAEKYNRKVAGVGKDRFGSGVQAAVQDMQTGMAPMVEAIAAVTPPARAPRGDVANQQRSVVYQVALNKKRLALRSAGA